MKFLVEITFRDYEEGQDEINENFSGFQFVTETDSMEKLADWLAMESYFLQSVPTQDGSQKQ